MVAVDRRSEDALAFERAFLDTVLEMIILESLD